MNLPQYSAHAAKLKAEGIKNRARLLALVPTEFTASQLADAAGLDQVAARYQIQKMLRWKEIGPTGEYKTPRVYRKVMK
jgi:hypothetical protein